MKNTVILTISSLFYAFGFSTPNHAHASSTASSQLSFNNLSITPDSGTVVLMSSWSASAFAQASAVAQYNTIVGGTATASMTGDYSAAQGQGQAQVSLTLSVFGQASANGNIPGSLDASDNAAGRGTVVGSFMITGGSGAVNVNLAANISGALSVSTDIYGQSAEAETVFSLDLNGSPTLFDDRLFSIGQNDSNSQIFSTTLFNSVPLQYNTTYNLLLEADAEANVVNVPEPSAYALVLTGLALWLGVKRRHSKSPSANRFVAHNAAVVLPSFLVLLWPTIDARAMYIGADPPQICDKCGAAPNRQSGGQALTSLSEGNLRVDYPVTSLASASGQTVQLSLTYNTYNADGSRAQVDCGLGLGWTHSYNIFLFQQRGSFFRMGADGRVTLYQLGAGNTYTADNGYFETLTALNDGSFVITNKEQSWWRFVSVPNTPFLVAGPVYRLNQMGDRNNNVTTLTYSNGLMTLITDIYGRSVACGYTNNHLLSITDPLGRTTSIQYDPRFRTPVRFTDPAGKVTRYSYNSLYQINKKIDRDGRTYLYLYKSLRPWAVTDGNGTPYFLQSNTNNWAVDRVSLAKYFRRIYTPSTVTNMDGNGNIWRYQYDTNGYITSVITPDGAVTTYSYDSQTRLLASMTDANGNLTRYQYDSQGNRTNLTDALGEVTTYTYEPVFNQITSVTDPIGRTTTYQYDSRGNRILEIDPLSQSNAWTYDSQGNVTAFTDKNGHTTTYIYDPSGNRTNMTDALGNVTTYTYDAIGNRLSTTDPLGHTTRYQYDPLNRVIGTTNALGGVTRYAYDAFGRQLSVTDPNTNVTTSQYDIRGRLIQTTDALGGAIQYGYDPNNNRIATTNQLGNPTTYGYDVQNRVIGATNPVGGVTLSTYDPVGNRVSSTDPNTNTTFFAYDALSRVVSTTKALGGVTAYDYAMSGGPPCCSPTPGSSLVTRMQDADGNVTFYHYDELDRRVQTVRKNSDTNDVINPTDAVTTSAYDPVGNVIAITDPNGNTTAYTYDADNRRVGMVNAAGDTTVTSYDGDGNTVAVTAPNNNTTTNSYDALNRVITVYDEIGLVRSSTYDADGNVLSTSDGLGHTTSYMYDGLNRQVQMTDALGHTTTTAYDADGNVTSTTDRNGHTTMYSYDGLDRRTSTTDALGNTTVTTYDPDSNVIGLTDANGHVTQYTYDALNRRVTEIYPDAPPNTITYTYDPVGNLISRIDQKGQTTTYSYNDLYYLTNRAYSPSGANDSFGYDNGGRMLSGNRNGWVDTFAYDGANRLTNTTQNGRVLTYTYNIPGRVQTNTQPSGRTLVYAYDARNRLATVQDGTAHPPIVTYTYDVADRAVTRMYRNGTTATYDYNANNWITSLGHSNGPSLIAGFSYAYDNENNRLSELQLDDPTNSEAYVYDPLNRLTNYNIGTLSGNMVPSPSLDKAWQLDPLGNWTVLVSNSVPQTRTHGPANELLTVDAQTFAYDPDGNLIQDSAYNYSYDEQNRLTQVQRLSDSAIVGRYLYDALGRRVISISDPAGASTTNVFIYDNARVIEDQNDAGLTQAVYAYGNYIDEVLTMDRGGQTYYYHQNALWSPQALTDSTGSVVERYTYDAYGQATVLDASYTPLASNAWGTPHSAAGNPYLFTGRELDEETGLYFYRARYYDAVKGRFLQRDPAGFIDGMNLYEYVQDNPALFVDPSGNSDKKGGGGGNGLPAKCRVILDRWNFKGALWNYIKHGWRAPIIGNLAAGGVLASCELTSDQIKAAAELCGGRNGLEAQILCALGEVHSAVSPPDANAWVPSVTENACRHYGRCFKKVWEKMGGEQTLTGRFILGGAGHSFNIIQGDGGTYYVDSFNEALIWCPDGT